MAQPATVTLTRHPEDPDLLLVSSQGLGRNWRNAFIYREDADPEHRFVEYRLAATWFGNQPAPATTS